MPDVLKISEIAARLDHLSDVQLALVDDVTRQLVVPPEYHLNPDSDLINEGIMWGLGDTLRIHHCFSAESFTKDRFEQPSGDDVRRR
ncbi:hypothetical protein [Rhizobium leguminosarum]|uniref:hypothetical protein n=1 Tax=Rhizobium leguminosarum TaxID=384 RepID=UPI001C8FE395|nr:hypothetical protein [Rhizobium leguminosarum]MBY2916166.1 hypothetical protein [Rhizobium leguminosarum]MBY2971401.1 hypothetical protein [Rhizobium leguminosarum]MBY2978803.1 hypothetical protein [Rhizobium leguminosarum]MBY3007354.1 hypothetical protein [Rhizobium leguminosarum]